MALNTSKCDHLTPFGLEDNNEDSAWNSKWGKNITGNKVARFATESKENCSI